MILTGTQTEVAVEWWTTHLKYMYNISEQEAYSFAQVLRAGLDGREDTPLDTRQGLPEILVSALATTSAGDNARERMRAMMSFPNGGVLLFDGSLPYPAGARRRRSLVREEVPAWRTPVEMWPVSLLLPFTGFAVVEEWLGHCQGPEFKDGKTTDHDKMWGACLVVTCAEEEGVAGKVPSLKWEYHARFGPRQGTIDEHIVRFDSDEHETDQQKAAKRYRTKVREQKRIYVPVPFDETCDPSSYYQFPSFTRFFPNGTSV